jgi:hypothetical protein
MIKSTNLVEGISPLNRWALLFFVFAKLCGAVGVCMGFMGREFQQLGGWLLGFAICSIFLSVALCLRQGYLDRIKFKHEDEEMIHLKDLCSKRKQLELEIADLENKRSAIERFTIRRSS